MRFKARLIFLFLFLSSHSTLAGEYFCDPSEVIITQVDSDVLLQMKDQVRHLKNYPVLTARLALASAMSMEVPFGINDDNEILVGYSGGKIDWLIDIRFIHTGGEKGHRHHTFFKGQDPNYLRVDLTKEQEDGQLFEQMQALVTSPHFRPDGGFIHVEPWGEFLPQLQGLTFPGFVFLELPQEIATQPSEGFMVRLINAGSHLITKPFESWHSEAPERVIDAPFLDLGNTGPLGPYDRCSLRAPSTFFDPLFKVLKAQPKGYRFLMSVQFDTNMGAVVRGSGYPCNIVYLAGPGFPFRKPSLPTPAYSSLK
jgi:hypothetical protein